MKELWTANPFCLMNRPFAEMGYNSSGLNIAPSAFCWQLAGPSRTIRLLPAHHPSTLCAPPADAPQTICNTRHNIWRPPPCKPSAVVLRSIWRPPTQHPPSRCAPSSGPLHSIRRLSACHLPASSPRDARRPPASHPPSHGTASFDPRTSSAGTLQAICWHEPMPLTARRTNRRRKQEPQISAKTRSA